MPTLPSFKIIVIAIAFGFGSGMWIDTKLHKASQTSSVVESRHESAANIKNSLLVSSQVDKQVDESNTQVVGIRKAVAQRLNSKERKDVKVVSDSNQSGIYCNATWNLDNGTAWLLNAARTGTPVNAASLIDEESKVASGITADQFIDNDLEVVELYKELAIEHNSLVDWAQTQIDKQAK